MPGILDAKKHSGFTKSSSPVVLCFSRTTGEVYWLHRTFDMGLQMSLMTENPNYIRYEGYSESNLLWAVKKHAMRKHYYV
jgi:hypothetical protein